MLFLSICDQGPKPNKETRKSTYRRIGLKLVRKKIMFKVKETQKMLQWIKMNANKHKWVRQVGLENLFTL
jgi:hypothetical protein